MHCAHCGRETPPGHYCAYCGADLTAQAQYDPRRRRHRFAAAPHEHVYHPGVVSTFFPHLGTLRAQQVRWVLLGGAAVVFLLGLGRFIPIAVVGAALLVPLLYLFYFYDVQIYENEPLRVLGGTFVLGALLGTGLSLVDYRAAQQLSAASLLGPTQQYVLVTGVLLPLAGQVLMLVGPLVLFFTRPRFDEVLDGLGFGVASGLGFAAANSIVFSWLLITGRFQQIGDPTQWVLPIIRISLLVPLVNAATTGLVCAALWLRRDPQPPTRALGAVASLPVALTLALFGQVVPAVGSDLRGGLTLDLAWYGGALLLLILLVRHVVHVGLVEKARSLGHGGSVRCPHCFHLVPDVPFCPHCGRAMRSAAKRARRPIQTQEQAQ
jgi:RsiW-degrading membrane proteinase PrsW (M82 family)